MEQFCANIVYYEFVVQLIDFSRFHYWKRELTRRLLEFEGKGVYKIFEFRHSYSFRFGFKRMPEGLPDDRLKELYRKLATYLVVERGFVPTIEQEDTSIFIQVEDDVLDELDVPDESDHVVDSSSDDESSSGDSEADLEEELSDDSFDE